jgi:hypothetical protein
MKLKYKEEPKEWRKSALLTLGGLALISSLLCWWRHVLTLKIWLGVIALLAVVAVCAALQPRWFRGWYRVSLWLGFYLSQFLGRLVLAGFFIFIVTPLGWLLRLAGQDPLQLKLPKKADSYWSQSREPNPLDRLF